MQHHRISGRARANAQFPDRRAVARSDLVDIDGAQGHHRVERSPGLAGVVPSVVEINEGFSVEPFGDATVIRHDGVPSVPPAQHGGYVDFAARRGPPSVASLVLLTAALVMPA